uniref:Uncharacterized protein n=1 Tax=uncultured marine virus TaxID=186617 RepID=A0A0F7L7M9_9VIRU|nr:hypothetical protein [uncultured marine virus]
MLMKRELRILTGYYLGGMPQLELLLLFLETVDLVDRFVSVFYLRGFAKLRWCLGLFLTLC